MKFLVRTDGRTDIIGTIRGPRGPIKYVSDLLRYVHCPGFNNQTKKNTKHCTHCALLCQSLRNPCTVSVQYSTLFCEFFTKLAHNPTCFTVNPYLRLIFILGFPKKAKFCTLGHVCVEQKLIKLQNILGHGPTENCKQCTHLAF